METGPRFKVSSDRLEKRKMNLKHEGALYKVELENKTVKHSLSSVSYPVTRCTGHHRRVLFVLNSVMVSYQNKDHILVLIIPILFGSFQLICHS